MDPALTFPIELQERLEALYPHSSIPQLFPAEKPTALRANSLKISPTQLRQRLQRQGFELEPVPWYDAAFIVHDNAAALSRLDEYASGLFYLQNLSSMVPALVLNPQPGNRVLDLTAAPGSKTTQLATLMMNQGEIIANDISRARTFKLRANVEQQGVAIVRTTTMPGEQLWKRFPEQFDCTLVDAPCTMEGRIQYDQPESWADWSLKKIKVLSRRQQLLLRSAVSATKPGGVIVYSTCTLAPEENEAVIEWMLEKEGDAVELEQVSLPGLDLEPGKTEWQGQHFSPELKKTARVTPSAEMEGFFVAKLRKLRTSVVPQLPRKKRNKYAR